MTTASLSDLPLSLNTTLAGVASFLLLFVTVGVIYLSAAGTGGIGGVARPRSGNPARELRLTRSCGGLLWPSQAGCTFLLLLLPSLGLEPLATPPGPGLEQLMATSSLLQSFGPARPVPELWKGGMGSALAQTGLAPATTLLVAILGKPAMNRPPTWLFRPPVYRPEPQGPLPPNSLRVGNLPGGGTGSPQPPAACRSAAAPAATQPWIAAALPAPVGAGAGRFWNPVLAWQ